jgi:hypothetical protein
MRRWAATLIPVVLLLPAPASGWGNEGHQVVARVAAERLSPEAQLRISELLEVGNDPQAVANALAKAAIWADEVKADTGTESWHFLNLTWQDSRANMGERCANDDCVNARLRLFAAQLKAGDQDADTRFSDDDALRFLVHFVGDLHQPLHAISNADRGGNCETLETGVDGATNLHALWDGPLVTGLGADDGEVAAELSAEIDKMTDEERADFSSGDPDDWAWEAHRLALVNVYKRLAIPKEDVAFPESCAEAPEEIRELHVEIDAKYIEEMRPIVRGQLKKAGLRLAKMLNEILG